MGPGDATRHTLQGVTWGAATVAGDDDMGMGQNLCFAIFWGICSGATLVAKIGLLSKLRRQNQLKAKVHRALFHTTARGLRHTIQIAQWARQKGPLRAIYYNSQLRGEMCEPTDLSALSACLFHTTARGLRTHHSNSSVSQAKGAPESHILQQPIARWNVWTDWSMNVLIWSYVTCQTCTGSKRSQISIASLRKAHRARISCSTQRMLVSHDRTRSVHPPFK